MERACSGSLKRKLEDSNPHCSDEYTCAICAELMVEPVEGEGEGTVCCAIPGHSLLPRGCMICAMSASRTKFIRVVFLGHWHATAAALCRTSSSADFFRRVFWQTKFFGGQFHATAILEADPACLAAHSRQLLQFVMLMASGPGPQRDGSSPAFFCASSHFPHPF